MFGLSVPVNANDSGDNVIVEGVSGKRITVMHYTLLVDDEVYVTFKSSGGSNLSGPMRYLAGATIGHTRDGHFQTQPGESLVIGLSSDIHVGGHVKYFLE